MTVPRHPQHSLGGVILCGGESSRMGTPKALLPFGEERMLERVVRLLSAVAPVENLVVAAAAGQELPPLPEAVAIAGDEQPGRGPLEGLRAGLAALPAHIEAAYVTSCDAPLLAPAFVRRMFDLAADYDIAVPVEDGFPHPLAAVYRPAVLPAIERLLSAGTYRTQELLGVCRTRKVPVEELREVDPELATLFNVNQPEDYQAALGRAGIKVDDVGF